MSKRILLRRLTLLALVLASAGWLPVTLHRRQTAQAPAQHRGAPAHLTQPPARDVSEGIKKTAELLPLARRLTQETLSELGAHYSVEADALGRARQQAAAVSAVQLDDALGDIAEITDEEPTLIRVGPGYARELRDDDAVLLLAHELAHAAAMGGALDAMIDQVVLAVARRTGIRPTEDQREDLFCDYVGAEALKRFARLRPGGGSPPERVGRALNAGQFESAADDDADQEHLSSEETWRAVLSLDPDLALPAARQ